MRTYENIIVSRRGRVLTLTLNPPHALNATNANLHAELAAAFTDADDDSDSDVVILTGAGRAFSAGGEIEFMTRMYRERSFYETMVKQAKRIIFSILDMEKPLIGKLNGHATGFGATIALFCDVTFANEHAKIGDPHVAVGLTAGDGAAIIWPQLIGFARAKELLMTGDLLTMKRAAEIGLINYAIPPEELDTKVDTFADRLVSGSRIAIRTTKMSVNIPLRQLASTMMDACLAYETLAALSPDHIERLTAFAKTRARTAPAHDE